MSWRPLLDAVYDAIVADTSTLWQAVRAVRYDETLAGVEFVTDSAAEARPVLLIVPIDATDDHTFGSDQFLYRFDVEAHCSVNVPESSTVTPEMSVSNAIDRVRVLLHRVTLASQTDGQSSTWAFSPCRMTGVNPIVVTPQQTCICVGSFEVYASRATSL